MATATMKPRKPPKARPPDVCRLTLHVRGVAYAVRFLDADPGAGVSALIRLRKADGTAYHVAGTVHGPTCDCGDQTWRHEGRASSCKHIRALKACGLL